MMKTRTIAFLAVAMTMGFGAIGVAACSSDSSSSSGALPGVDSSVDSTSGGSSGTSGTSGGSSGTSGGSSGTSGGSSGTSGSSGGGDAGSDCGKAPQLEFEDGGTGPYCPFHDGGSPEAGRNCAAGESCCHPNNTDPETCSATCTEPDGGATFQCDTKAECPAGQFCYMNGTVQSDPVCLTLFGSKVKGTSCHASPALAGEVEICSASGECQTASQTCSPFSTKGRNLGYCH
jgi:hypothetical protein